MQSKEDLGNELSELAEKVRSLAADGSDLDALLAALHALHEKIILLKHYGLLHPGPVKPVEKISPDIYPDIINEVRTGESLLDKFPKNEDGSLPHRFQRKKIDELRSFIGLNERFRFINGLFAGKPNEFAAALNQLDMFTSFPEAESYLSGLKDIYKWEDDHELVAHFRELVYRRFL